jgi:aspartyl-tRNA synthetase
LPRRFRSDRRGRALITEIKVPGPAGELPLPVLGKQDYPEDTRLKYHFLDLHRDKLHQNIMTRGKIVDPMRRGTQTCVKSRCFQ